MQVDEQPFGRPLIIEDMPHMAQFVYDFYQEKLQVLHAKLGVSIYCCLFELVSPSFDDTRHHNSNRLPLFVLFFSNCNRIELDTWY